MPDVVHIAAPADPRIVDYVGLTDPELRRRRERSHGTEGGFFIAEGDVVIRRLVRSAFLVRSFLLTPGRWAALGPELADVDAPVHVATQPVMDAIAGFHLHRGALASVDRPPPADPAALAEAADLVVAVEGVNDHENLGALFRNAAAFGAGAVILDPTTADPFYRRAVRVSAGQVLHVPFGRVANWPDALTHLGNAGFEVLALIPSPEALDLRAVASRPKQAVVVGAEGPGLSAGALAAADHRVRIAMAPGVDSLNVATAAAVALHHLARRRPSRR
ncbi:MAG: rRNA methyltransferase [Candidatus Aeolococcus gillhamiae]|uniref:rRNA methyltransferase n=1 Tax=Candidatus Aeolococcus gillhamiae TaxID=3127015 RepID=A0A2W5Z451_9BACT|nr:MAG: rRNA methyltransferase [Candidatus Dormibacter sp. RRmetagenome_bin12]